MRAAPTASAAARASASRSSEIAACRVLYPASIRHATHIIGSMIANGIVYYIYCTTPGTTTHLVRISKQV